MKALKDLGENYEYIRVIAKNKIELKKLDLIEDTSQVVSSIILIVISTIFFTILIVSLSVAFVLWLSTILQSLITSILVFCGLIICMLGILFIFRNALIIKPVISKYYSLIKNRI